MPLKSVLIDEAEMHALATEAGELIEAELIVERKYALGAARNHRRLRQGPACMRDGCREISRYRGKGSTFPSRGDSIFPPFPCPQP